jgi:lipopolysaccharide export system permease protein
MAKGVHISPTLSYYIARRFFAGFMMILLTIVAIIFLIDIVELLRRGSGRAEVTFELVLQLALLKLPYMAEKVFPFATLFGGMYSFRRLTRTSELVVARASGVSVWQFLFPAVITALFIGIFAVGALNPLSATLLLRYEQLEGQLLKGNSDLLSVSESGLWLRQADPRGEAVIHAKRMSPQDQDMVLNSVTVYLFDAQNRFARRLDATDAKLAKGAWQLRDVLVTAPNVTSRKQAIYKLATDWTPNKIQDSFSPPETLSFWRLPGFIELLEKAGFTATRHRVHWYSLLAMPVMLAAMVMIAAMFSLRMARRGGVALLIGSGIMFSFFIFFLSDVIVAMGLSSAIPPLLAAITPAAVTTLIGASVLLHIEDG